MSEFTPYLVVVWLVVMLGVFPSFTTHRAILVVVLGGTLFLPELRQEVALGPFHFSKYHAINYAALLGALLYDSERLFSGAPRWTDLPMVVWCLCPLPSVLTNAPPPDGSSAIRDALSQTWSQTVSFGIPYLLGRVYFSDSAAVRDLALGIVFAAAVYAPLCLYEARMSPQLHANIYGYSQHSFAQTIRFGGYRPMVFLPHGLAVGMFMVSAALIATWMWWTGTLRPVIEEGEETGLQSYIPLLLVPIAILLKSTGALVLGFGGGLVLWLASATGARWWLLLLAVTPPVYAAVRTTGAWSGEALVESVAANLDSDRAESLDFRLTNENLLVNKALDRPTFGWGGWGRNRVFDEKSGKDLTVTDGLWIIVLGDRGLVGLVALGAVLLLPIARFALLFPPSTWSTRSLAPTAACAVVLTLWSIDSLMNAMVLPVYLLLAGSLMGFALDASEEPDEASRAGELVPAEPDDGRN